MAKSAAGPVYPVVFIDAIVVKIRDWQGISRPIYGPGLWGEVSAWLRGPISGFTVPCDPTSRQW